MFMGHIIPIATHSAASTSFSTPSNESLAISGSLHGQIPAELYYRLRRTLKPGEQRQRQNPVGDIHTSFSAIGVKRYLLICDGWPRAYPRPWFRSFAKTAGPSSSSPRSAWLIPT